jgi:hypothetical protein
MRIIQQGGLYRQRNGGNTRKIETFNILKTKGKIFFNSFWMSFR